MKPAYILAMDTALNGCSVAIFNAASDKCYAISEAMTRGQSERLVPMIEEVIDKAGIKKQQIDLVAVTVGPGAFTGLRIGLSTAKVFAQALGAPVIGMSTLEILARQYFISGHRVAEKDLLVAIDTKRSDYYCQFFTEKGRVLTEPFASDAKTANSSADKAYVVCGDGAERFIDDAGLSVDSYIKGVALVNPCLLALAGLEVWRNDPEKYPPAPIYIREAEVSAPKKLPRVINSNT